MRHYTDHRFEEAGFNDAVQGIVKNSPWWLISLVAHLLLLFILASSWGGSRCHRTWRGS